MGFGLEGSIPGLPQVPVGSSLSPPGSEVASLTEPEKTPGWVPTQDTVHREPTRQAASRESEEVRGAGGPLASMLSIMKRKEEIADHTTHQRSLQFVGINGGAPGPVGSWALLGSWCHLSACGWSREGDDTKVVQRPQERHRYESSSEDSSTTENISDNDSTENEAPELGDRVPSVAAAPQLRPAGTAVARTSRQQCQLSRESQHIPPVGGASGSNTEEEIRMELSPDLISACLALEKYLDNPNTLTERELVRSGPGPPLDPYSHHTHGLSSSSKVAYTTVLQEWLRLACRSDAHPELVRRHLVTFRAMSGRLLDYVVNIADSNGNTALHYSVSHANFPVVQQLLDSGEPCGEDEAANQLLSAIPSLIGKPLPSLSDGGER
ncbi:KN motif and ankyrin repeat domain-containing protein 2 [Saguinus oedipus]|uniref:KN motif and ankyrin repeat domain-containing protein 2 n=1 Tax=Saguinus oedipus TaxID=9490 RepID=A0ABQ9TRG6_SAGOE|nr:KN motif and ankyrin repeat domain-containing protein 2 [Saguinus oedipus]